MKTLCVETFSHNPQCVQAASMYTMGVSMFGGGGFAESEEVYCECINEADVPKHYQELFENFMFHLSASVGFLRNDLHLITPSGVPTKISLDSSLMPRQMPSAHLSSHA